MDAGHYHQSSNRVTSSCFNELHQDHVLTSPHLQIQYSWQAFSSFKLTVFEWAFSIFLFGKASMTTSFTTTTDYSQNSTALWSLISGYSIFRSFPAMLRLTVIPTETHCKCKWFMLGMAWKPRWSPTSWFDHGSKGRDDRRSLSASSASRANGCWPQWHRVALCQSRTDGFAYSGTFHSIAI